MRTTPSGAAYQAFLQGRYWAGRHSIEGYERSGQAFERALELDPSFAMAHVAMALRCLAVAAAGVAPGRESLPLCCDHAGKALAIDPSLAEARSLLGVVAAAHDYDWQAAAEHFRVALAGRPAPNVRFHYAYHYLLPLGRFDEAIAQIEEGLYDDPLNLLQRSRLAISLAAAGRMEESGRSLQTVLDADERFWIAWLVLAANETSRGNLEAARTAAERAHVCSHWNAHTTGLTAGLLSLAGAARRAADLLEHLSDGDGYGAPIGLLDYHLVRGEVAAASEWGLMAIARRDPMVPIVLQHPYARALRESPRWNLLASAMRIPHR